jgi:hypothetical protein
VDEALLSREGVAVMRRFTDKSGREANEWEDENGDYMHVPDLFFAVEDLVWQRQTESNNRANGRRFRSWGSAPMGDVATFLPNTYYCQHQHPSATHRNGNPYGCDLKRGHVGLVHVDYSSIIGLQWSYPVPVPAPAWVQAAVMGAMMGL